VTGASVSGRTEWLPIGCVIGAVTFELVIRERFYEVSAEVAPLVQIMGLWAALLIVTSVTASTFKLCRYSVIVNRLSLLVATAASLSMLLAGNSLLLAGKQHWSVKLVAAGALASGFWVLATKLSDARWRRLRWAASLGCVLFVACQPLLVAALAPRISWPAWKKEAMNGLERAPKSAQVFLLLDELNASSAGPIVDALKRSGVEFQMKAIDAVGDGTAKVIPAMFSGGNFEDAKPCGAVSTCGTSDVLDFSKVTASRDDVDVVGFYMPYCAINGLRFCERLSVASPLFDWKRWVCASLRRMESAPRQMVDTCAQTHSLTWGRLTDEVEAAIWRAPLWKQGGFMYAHVPLPHPPGLPSGASLEADYSQNVLRASRLVERIVLRARAENIRALSLVIFSDHPLRLWLWCGSLTYASHSCRPDDGLADRQVPLIVAGDLLPPIDGLTTNKEVFTIRPAQANSPR